ncbi:MAG TPA: transglutaminase-like cysteine peptidase [Alphaproteobacteria bacterium]|jgi:predicted transglutaminase-like cysteine proteinase
MFAGFARGEKWGTSLAAFAALAFASCAAAAAPADASEPLPAAVAAPAAVRLFGSGENTNADISPFPKWTDVLARYAREQHLENAPCTGGRCALQEWKAFVTSLNGQDRRRQLDAVNAYANRIPYMPDQARYGIIDYWATPRESLGRSADCEDYAIVKYLSLRKLGWSAGELRIVVLKHEVRNELHAVLVAYLDGTAYVLDNLIPDVREHAAIRYYRPIFSINEAAWHYHRDWNPGGVMLVARAPVPMPERAPSGETRILSSTQIAGPVPPAIDTAHPRYTDQRPLVRPVARSYAANRSESIAELFANAGTVR